MGTPVFALAALQALVGSPHDIVAVYTQPPRPSGRGHNVQKSPVQDYAEAQGIPVRHPVSLKPQEAKDEFLALDLDCAIVAAYGLILPKAILDAPRYGCLNIHGSLLPRWRGAAPIQRAILAGDAETGITIMQMEAGLDTGAMLVKEPMPITSQTTAVTLHDALAAMGARLIVPALEGFVAGTILPQAQPAEGVTYADKLTREDGRLDFTKAAADLDRQIRALVPWPGTFFDWQGETIKVSEARIAEGSGEPGALLRDDLTIACGVGALTLTNVQRPGKSWQDGASFLRGLRS
jgi:methionyl-tRNA formyltransferase